MQIDCKYLECPQPVIKVKQAIDTMQIGETLEVSVDNEDSIVNLKRFALSRGHDFSYQTISDDDQYIVFIKKNLTLNYHQREKTRKIVYLKDDKVGEGELGQQLMIKFIKTMLEVDDLPSDIFLVNRGVLLASENEATVEVFRKMIQKGVRITACGTCVDYFDVKLAVGDVGNSFSIIDEMMSCKEIICL